MRVRDYYQLLAENRFKIHVSRIPMTCIVSCCTVINSTLAGIQKLAYGERIDQTKLIQPPLFIIGHWRSGTTLMHELMSMDRNLAYPTNFDAFVPHHLLVSRWLLYPIVSLLLPSKRPMDNMAMGGGSPQEDDFACCALGAPTPYRRIAFPNSKNQHHLQLNLARAQPNQRQDLETSLRYFFSCLTLQYKKRLLLKSPPHTGRIQWLAKWFPGAKFIHLSRNPNDLVPSTMHLWRSLDATQGHQLPRYDDVWLKNYVFECQDLMYQAYFDQKKHLQDNQLVEIAFEDLVSSPVEQVARVYQQLQLEGFEELQPKIEQSLSSRKSHERNTLQLDEKLKVEIDHHWREYKKAFGYLDQVASAWGDG